MTAYVILFPKLSNPTVRKDCSRDRENLLKFGAEVQEFAKLLIPLEQFIWTVQINLCQKLLFLHQLTHNMTTMKTTSAEPGSAHALRL